MKLSKLIPAIGALVAGLALAAPAGAATINITSNITPASPAGLMHWTADNVYVLGTVIQGGIFYNVTGETLLTGAATGENGGVPNSFAEDYRTVDFTYSQKIVRGRVDVSFTLKAKNFMEPERTSVYRTPDEQEVIRTLRDTAALYGLSFNLK